MPIANHRQFLLLKICQELNTDMSYFVDPTTGVIREHFKELLLMRMMKLGIYSVNELGRNLGLGSPTALAARINSLDRYAAEANIKLKEFQQQQQLKDDSAV